MTNQGPDFSKPGRPEVKYSEFSRETQRSAAVFAINCFSQLYQDHVMQRLVGVELSDSQLTMATSLREEIFPKARQRLPESAGSGGAIVSAILEAIPTYLRAENSGSEEIPSGERALIQKDPTGVSLLGSRLAAMDANSPSGSARMMFDQYKWAVDYYLDKWGTKSSS